MKVKDKIAVIFVLVLSLTVFLYCGFSAFVKASIIFWNDEADAVGITWSERGGEVYLLYSYFNRHDSTNYTIEKKIGRRHQTLIQAMPSIRIKYSIIYPDYTTINGIIDYSLLFVLLGVALTSVSIYRCILVLTQKNSVSNFLKLDTTNGADR